MKKVIALFFVSLMAVSFVQAHSGGTDKNGCHAGSKPYHCH
ncbi:YHYH domain-containing protein [Marinomonas colpomeniae]|uniref:YHYH domain-containing protein n=1 Tax=Marinomonas colpomeniae TaxID=2774408 RepID=A0ABR8NVT1_9GAMM|nr:YHYH domain-containing protein [Marinomonas colpomeniae]MBD5770159.1 YHYH domain-containing protein [Marinomonas colpomeniae]